MLINDFLAEFLLGEEKEKRPSEKEKRCKYICWKRNSIYYYLGGKGEWGSGRLSNPPKRNDTPLTHLSPFPPFTHCVLLPLLFFIGGDTPLMILHPPNAAATHLFKKVWMHQIWQIKLPIVFAYNNHHCLGERFRWLSDCLQKNIFFLFVYWRIFCQAKNLFPLPPLPSSATSKWNGSQKEEEEERGVGGGRAEKSSQQDHIFLPRRLLRKPWIKFPFFFWSHPPPAPIPQPFEFRWLLII